MKNIRSNPLGMNEDPTTFGQCQGTTKGGKPCGHRVVFVNGLCAQHGGRTPESYKRRVRQYSQEKFAKHKARLERRVKRLEAKKKKWQERSSGASEQASVSAPVKTDTASPAAPSKLSWLSPLENLGAGSTAATASRRPPRLPKLGSDLGRTFQDRAPRKAGNELTKTSNSPAGAIPSSGEHKRSESESQSSIANSRLEASGAVRTDKDDGAKGHQPNERPLAEAAKSAEAAPARAYVSDPSHWSLVPGRSWSQRWLRQYVRGSGLRQEPRQPTADVVDPKTFPD